MPAIFPFTAVVGQERMEMVPILNAIGAQIGGVLVRGEGGIGGDETVVIAGQDDDLAEDGTQGLVDVAAQMTQLRIQVVLG